MIDSFFLKQSYVTGFRPDVLFRTLKTLPSFCADWFKYQKLASHLPKPLRLKIKDIFPILTDRIANAGVAEGHYFYQDLWAAKKIFQNRPVRHLDVGSRIDGFVAHLLTFMAVEVIDIRPISGKVDGLTMIQDDATLLPRIPSNSVPSLSSLHVAEHLGLGRYLDPIDPFACFKFMQSLQRVLAPGGRLYFSVPIGRERVEFNAHRVFAVETILEQFSDLALVSFSFIGDDGVIRKDTHVFALPKSDMACGLFEFTKPADNSSVTPIISELNVEPMS